jgi:hypothetical protein
VKNKILALTLLVLYFPPGLVALSAEAPQRKYYNKTVKYFSQGESAYRSRDLQAAYKYYDKTISSATASKNLERLRLAESKKMDYYIRNSRNEKFRILQAAANFKKLINENKIVKGMDKEQVRLSWGEPKDIEKKIYKWEQLEIWRYGNVIRGNDKYVYFSNGKVIDWQDYSR